MPEGSSAPEQEISQFKTENSPQNSTNGLRAFINRAKEIKTIRNRGTKDAVLRTALEQSQQETNTQSQRAEEAESNSITDQLIGIKNRRWYDEQLSIRLSKTERHSGQNDGFYAVVYDLDKLKDWNDCYGSAGADEILKNVKNIPFRTGEDIARIGGDEFGQLINSGTTEEDILTIVRRNAGKFYDLGEGTIPHLPLKPNRPPDKEPPKHSTFSVGVIKVMSGMTAEEIKKLSDVAIAHSKTQRDSIAISRDGVTVEMVPRYVDQKQAQTVPV